ncbi:MAG TPA: glycosyltransferase family 4 protein [Acidimicrobiia bacterium]|nr:glycosyltransferase family 4 protein [Acidimicrobiia bacterium]
MRVVMTCPYSLSRPGGVQQQVLALVRELRVLGVDARALAPCDGPPPAPGVISVGPSVEWESNGSIAPIAASSTATRRTIAALRDVRPHVVHLHEPAVPGPSLSTLIGCDVPMVGTFHSSGDVLPAEWMKPPLTGLMQRLAVAVAVSDAAAQTADDCYGVDDARVLWNGIDVERFAHVSPTRAPRPAVLFVGRHEERKGLGVLLDAWQTLERDAVLWVVGSGPQTEALRARRTPGVEWLGTVSDAELASRLRGATIFCAPSTYGESFGIVLLEAMAARTAVVATAIEGYSNVARPDREAVLVEPNDPIALRDALRTVLDDEVVRARLVEAGTVRAAGFSVRRLAEAYVELYGLAAATRP